jgi:hypothetical protein
MFSDSYVPAIVAIASLVVVLVLVRFLCLQYKAGNFAGYCIENILEFSPLIY